MSVFDGLKLILLAHLFFSFSVNTIVYTMPDDVRDQFVLFSTSPAVINASDVQTRFQNSITQQTNFSVIEVAALALYSGNIFVDLFLNFVFAVPAMANIIWNALFFFIPLDVALQTQFKLLAGVIITVLFVLGLLRFLTASRASGAGGLI